MKGCVMTRLRVFLFLVASSVFGSWVCGGAQAATPSTTLEQARVALEQSSAVVIDIREPEEHATGVAKGALLIPMGQLEKRLAEIVKSKNQPIILFCATQNRSSRLAAQLQAAGYSKASYAHGGMSQWAARGWPLVKPPK